MAGGEGGSQKMGVKALGLPCSSQALCVNAESRQPPLESVDGQRLTAWPRSHIVFFVDRKSQRADAEALPNLLLG